MADPQQFTGTKKGQFWGDKFLVGGSDPLQTAGEIVRIESSGTEVIFETAQSLLFTAGSPFGTGVSAIQLAARGNISGGMFVSASGNLAVAAAADTKAPIGMALPGVDVASGGTVTIITHGVVPVVAEATIATDTPAIMGGGAALNTVQPATAASGVRIFSLLDDATSGQTHFAVMH